MGTQRAFLAHNMHISSCSLLPLHYTPPPPPPPPAFLETRNCKRLKMRGAMLPLSVLLLATCHFAFSIKDGKL